MHNLQDCMSTFFKMVMVITYFLIDVCTVCMAAHLQFKPRGMKPIGCNSSLMADLYYTNKPYEKIVYLV